MPQRCGLIEREGAPRRRLWSRFRREKGRVLEGFMLRPAPLRAIADGTEPVFLKDQLRAELSGPPARPSVTKVNVSVPHLCRLQRPNKGWKMGVNDLSEDEIERIAWATPLSLPPASSWTEDTLRTLLHRLWLLSFHPPDLVQISGVRTADAVRLARDCRDLLSREETVVQVRVPPQGRVHVFGDLHGHFHDLVQGIERVGMPEDDRNLIVFDGDFVDRGSWSVECMILLMALKLWKPGAVFLLRGNHETSGCVVRYGLEAETRRKYGDGLFKAFLSLFRELPVAAVVIAPPTKPAPPDEAQKSRKIGKKRENAAPGCLGLGRLGPGEQRTMIVHGGLFRRRDRSGRSVGFTIGSLDELAELKRNEEDPMDSMTEDVIWSDPQLSANDVSRNELRGAGILYGRGALEKFLVANQLTGLIRGHEGPDMREKRPGMGDMLSGFSWDMEFGSGKFLLTLFSASEYPMDQPRSNRAAFATIHGRQDPLMPVGGPSIQPEITSLSPPRKPKYYELYYDSTLETQPGTPRN